MSVDLNTVQWMMFAIQLMMAIYNLLIWYAMRAERAPLWWAAANLLGCVAAVAFLHRDPYSGSWMNVLFGVCVVGVPVCLWIGLRVALEQPAQIKRLMALLAAHTLILSIFTIVEPILWVRFTLVSLLIAVLSAVATLQLRATVRRFPWLSLRLFMGLFIVHGLTFTGGSIGMAAFRLDASYGTLGSAISIITTVEGILFVMLYNFGASMLLQEKLRHRVEQLAVTDALTGLPNRHQLSQFFDEIQIKTTGQPTTAAIGVLDLDGFKEVNDMLGHQRGDKLLILVAQALKATLGPEGRIVRLGGDEFALVLVGKVDPDAHIPICHRLLSRLREPFILDGAPVHIGGSIGLTLVYHKDADLTEALRQADIAMYAAKAAGRDNLMLFSAAMDANTQELGQLRNDLRRAIALSQCHLLYQPKWDVTSQPHTLVGVEALMRWRHPIRGMVPPSVFIPLAESSGQIGALGDWALEQAIKDATLWPELTVAVNLSPAQFEAGDLAHKVERLLQRYDFSAGRLELELTEGVFLRDEPTTRTTVRQLAAIGTRLALDDFGTGYSSLGYLKDYKFQTVKIDRSFVRDCLVRAEAQAITQAVIQLARALQVDVVAEGVETQEELAMLRAMGCPLVQGYLLGKPMHATEIAALLATSDAAEAPRKTA
jgi:diguanylate cyclase (GGDEF)-like protein